jgi:hypothetical protein
LFSIKSRSCSTSAMFSAVWIGVGLLVRGHRALAGRGFRRNRDRIRAAFDSLWHPVVLISLELIAFSESLA